MTAEPRHSNRALPLHLTRQIDALCDEFEAALQNGSSVAIQSYLVRVDTVGRDQLITELAFVALDHLRRQGASDPVADLFAANPELSDELNSVSLFIDGARTVTVNSGSSRAEKSSGLAVRCPHCRSNIVMVVDASLVDIACTNCGGKFSLVNESEKTRDAPVLTRIAHFELIERLGMGEFGTVWKARDTVLQRTVALKIPRREKLDAESIEKFMREARAAAQLRHPNIVSTHEVGRDTHVLYIVTDYIRGASLSDVIADHRLTIRESLVIAAKMADALEHAHRSGVVHRDLKPSNILLDDNGEPHLMDFGLAKRKETEVTITVDGAVLGTPAYMSPEQARGEASQVDGRSDIYSLGVLLFQLLTGELPFRGTIRVLLHKVINDEPPGPRALDSRVPRDVDTICLKCMEKDPARRYAKAGELAADLRRFMAGEPIVARRIGPIGRTLRWARRNRAVSILLGATLITLLLATVISSYFAWHAAQNAIRADREATAVTNTLYDSLLQEARLTREVRKQGYGDKVHQLIDKARHLQSANVNKDALRRELVLAMGDFAAYQPTLITPSAGEITAIRLGNDGTQLFVGFNNGLIKVFDVRTRNVSDLLEGSHGQIVGIATSADGGKLIAADRTGSVRAWQHADRKWQVQREFKLGDHTHWTFLSRNGEFAACFSENSLDVWNVATGTKLRSLPTEPDWLMKNGAFDIARHRIAAGYMNDQAAKVGWAIWNLDTGQRLYVADMPMLGGTYANDLDLSELDDRLAIGFDEALLNYDLHDFQRIRLTGYDATKAVAFSPAHSYLAAINIRGSLSLWNSLTNRQLATLQLPGPRIALNCISFSADGGGLAVSNSESVQIWNLNNADEKTLMRGHQGGIPCAIFHPNGGLLFTGGKDYQVRAWDPSSGKLIKSLNAGEAVQSLSVTHDGRFLLLGCTGKEGEHHLRIVDVESFTIIYESEPSIGELYSVALAETADGTFLAGSGAHGAELWKVHRQMPIHIESIFKKVANWCLATVLSRDARTLVWVRDERQLMAWDLVANQKITLHAPELLQGWHGLSLLPDGESMVYVSQAGVAEIWNVKTDRRVASLGNPGTFSAPHIAVSPDGKWLAALTEPDTVSLWNIPRRQYVFSMRPEMGTVWSLAWDSSSTQLAVGQSDGGLAVWRLAIVQKKLAATGLPWPED